MINKIELHNIFSKLREGDNSQFELLYKNYNYLFLPYGEFLSG